jgi:ABC-type lipopolysaccharide export system ATPase subunit
MSADTAAVSALLRLTKCDLKLKSWHCAMQRVHAGLQAIGSPRAAPQSILSALRGGERSRHNAARRLLVQPAHKLLARRHTACCTQAHKRAGAEQPDQDQSVGRLAL